MSDEKEHVLHEIAAVWRHGDNYGEILYKYI